jgi:hypothetical protein
MLDFVVLLTPFIILVVLLLLGFVGCSIIYNPDNLPDPPNDLTFVARVSVDLTVTAIRFRWTDPNDVVTEVTLDNPAGTPDGANNVFSHLAVMNPLAGAWIARCRVTVRDAGGDTAQDQGEGTFLLDGAGGSRTASFQASGTPAGGDFVVMYVGLT